MKKSISTIAAKSLPGALFVATMGFACSCSTLSTKSPAVSYPFPPATVDTASEESKALNQYREAQKLSSKSHAKACTIWLELANNPRFPLNSVAGVHAVETCPQSQAGVPQYSTDTIDPWLREKYLRAALARAVKAKDRENEMRLSFEVAPLENQQTKQIRLLQRSIELAKALGAKVQDPVQAPAPTATPGAVPSAAQALPAPEVNELDQFLINAKLTLEQRAPRFIENPTPLQYMLVANDLKRAREFTKARDYYRKVLAEPALPDLEKWRALDGIRMTHKLVTDKENFVKITREYVEFARKKFTGPQIERYFDANLALARAVWTENQPKEAEAILEKVERELKGKFPLDESIFIRARIEEEAGNFAQAVEILNKIKIRRYMDRGFKSKILWLKAWNLRKLSRYPEAIAAFEQLNKDEASSTAQARTRFWLARTLKEASHTDRANDEFNWLIENDPLGYYGMLAYRELGQKIPVLSPLSNVQMLAAVHPPRDREPSTTSETTLPATAEASTSVPNEQRAELPLTLEEQLKLEWMTATNETEIGRRYLDFLTAGKRSTYTPGQAFALLQAYARTGNYQTLFSRLSELTPEARRQVLESEPSLIFPQPWMELVRKSARKVNIHPELIYSIMRQESSFNPEARSIADAFGLMQLIPQVAERAENMTGIKLEHHEDLYKPEMNITLGAAFLRILQNKWKDRFIPTVASYNASENAVSGWLKTRDAKDPVQFIEDIPYEETRNYVKLVMRNFIFYSRLNSKQPAVGNSSAPEGAKAVAAIDFPEWCLQGLQDINN